MPLCKPKSGEDHDKFMSRCMGDETMMSEYKDEDQRYAVCESQWGKKSAATPVERRNYTIETLSFEEREDKVRHLVGHAAVFDSEFDAGFFIERIERGAFAKSIKKDDVRALWNHDPNYVLGRNKSKTLTMKEEDDGLLVDIIPPDTQWARDLTVSIDRGDVSQMSFGFEPLDVEWIRGEKNKPDTRILREVRLWDVSPVTFPAYADTDVGVRSYKEWLKTIPPGDPLIPWKTRLYQRKLYLLGGLSNG